MLFLRTSNFSSRLFVIASLASLIMVGIFYSYFKFSIGYEPASIYGSTDKYYLATSLRESDPFITRKPNLKDMLAGPIITSLDPSLGLETAPVAIVEFSDFTCGYCQKQEQTIKMILEKYNGQVRLFWKDYPDRHPDSISYQSAVAARCAGEQDKFWPYHDQLYLNSGKLKNDYSKIAALLGLDQDSFNECLKSSRNKKLIDDNIAEADALGLSGVPFIYVNDQEVMGEISYEDLERIVKIELNK